MSPATLMHVNYWCAAKFCASFLLVPFHSHIDGDLTIILSMGDKDADPNRIALLAAGVLQRSVVKAVKNADGLGVLPAWKDRGMS